MNMVHKADYILNSDLIFTGVSDDCISGSVAVSGNKIIAVGERDQMNHLIGPQTKQLDFGKQLLMAGFSDAHMHFFEGSVASSKYVCTKIEKSKSEEECIQMMVDFANQNPDLERIIGTGWLQVNWNNAPLPSCKSLDLAFGSKPAYLLCGDGHTFWLNSAALKECNITKETSVEFGEIGKDEAGELNGLLIEVEACALAWNHIYEMSEEIMKEVQRAFSRQLAAVGITSVCDMTSKPMPEADYKSYEIASNLSKKKELLCRLHLYPSLGVSTDFELQKKLREQYHDGKVQVCGLKQFVDGVTTTYTGYLLEPYTDKPDTYGYTNYSKEVYQRSVIAANKEGFSVRLHTIADGSVRLALDLYEESNEKNGNGNIRNCLEHCENIHPMDVPRFQQLNVVPSMQPYHLIADADEKIQRMGEERGKQEWPYKTLLNSGACLAFGTDYPVVNFHPFTSIYAAISRCDEYGKPVGVNPNEALNVAQTLRAYTYGGAYSHNREKELGTLEEGKLADIIVIDKDLFHIPTIEILKAKVMFTMMDGEIVYKG